MPDEFIQRFLNDPASREAREWLNEGNTLGELPTTEESLALVEQAYAAGAVKVIAVEIDEYDELENTGKLVVELPTEAKLRAAVFAWAAPLSEEQGFEPDEEKGQSHIFLMLD